MSLIVTILLYLIFFVLVWFIVSKLLVNAEADAKTVKMVNIVLLLIALIILIVLFFGGGAGVNLPRW